MVRAWGLVIVLLVFSLERADADTRDAGNAALKYWQAFATLPHFTEAEQEKMSQQHLAEPLDAGARDLAKRGAYSLRMLHLGAALPQCNWGIPYEEGIDVYLPHAQAARSLCSLACLRARVLFEDGKPADAVDDLVATIRLGRDVSRDGIYITLLVGYAVEHNALETLALDLPALPAKTLQELKARLAGLPAGGNPAATLRNEEHWALDWFLRKVKETKDPERLAALLGQCSDSNEKKRDPAERGRTILQECGGTADGVIRCADETRRSYELMEKKISMPLDQFEAEWDRERTKQAGNPVFRLIYPAIHGVRLAQARLDIRRSLLAAALDVQSEGVGALQKHVDPVAGKPFEYSAFEGGFELHSSWKVNDALKTKWQLNDRLTKPVTLTVGRKGK
jgi:hypothetical protein